MQQSDFDIHNIRYFTKREIESTGAKLDDVQVELFAGLDKLRRVLGVPITLLPGGLTTGDHRAVWHGRGLAGDFALDTVTAPETVFKSALLAGFKGIGIYWNGAAYSYHVDLRPDFSFWTGRKLRFGGKWSYGTLIVDPRVIN